MDHGDRHTAGPDAQRLAELLRRHRALAGLTQQQLAQRVGYSRSSVANAEAGDVRAPDFYRRCDAVLGAAGAVEAARTALAAPPPADGSGGTNATAPLDATPPLHAPAPLEATALVGRVPPAELVEHLRRHWHLLVRTDDLLGPHAALPATLDHLAALAALAPRTTGPLRTTVRRLSARYAATSSWLHQDTGHPDEAAAWAGRALEWAHESDDRATLAWALHRHSRLRADEGDTARALALARAALRSGRELEASLGRSPLAAALRVQYARCCAAVGDRRRCERLLRQASAIADVRECAGDERTGFGGHCTRAWVLAARGECALVLGVPAGAVTPLRTSLALLAPAYHRNRGLVAGWLAEALLRLGAADEARSAVSECRQIGEATRSASVLAQARVVSELLNPSVRPGSAA